MSSNKRKRHQLSARKVRKWLKRREADLGEERRKIEVKAASLGLSPIDRSKLRSRSVMPSSQVPTLAGKYYLDWNFVCKDCGESEVWTGAQQKWWHEEMAGDWERIAVRCHDCRMKERQRRDDARRIHLEGIERKGKAKEKGG